MKLQHILRRKQGNQEKYGETGNGIFIRESVLSYCSRFSSFCQFLRFGSHQILEKLVKLHNILRRKQGNQEKYAETGNGMIIMESDLSYCSRFSSLCQFLRFGNEQILKKPVNLQQVLTQLMIDAASVKRREGEGVRSILFLLHSSQLNE